jgi:gamma-glutamyltranspeptidase / glutathione hydrolase
LILFSRSKLSAIVSAGLLLTYFATVLRAAEPVRRRHAMVVSIQRNATDAGVEVLKRGGNAVDAAVATGFALAVTYAYAGNLGGGGFMLVRMKNGDAYFLDYREKAPMASTRDMYLDAQGNVIPGLSLTGYKASGVPGSVAGLVKAEKLWGKLGLRRVMAPAITLARDGYTLNEEEARMLRHAEHLGGFPESKRIFQRNGDFYKAGEVFRQPDLAKTLQRISRYPDDFYHGQIARTLAADIQKGGGLITTEDLAQYQPIVRKPLRDHYHGYEIIAPPPPSSGGIAMIESLNILGGYDLARMGDRSPKEMQLIIEAFRRAFMDRTDYLGDPDYVQVPVAQLASAQYAAAWRKSIVPGAPTPSSTLVRPQVFLPPPPASGDMRKEAKDTTQYSVVDRRGNAVSVTTTLNGGFGSAVTAEGLGFLMNNEMDDFAAKQGVPNMFGLIQGPANAIAPGKRPLSSMTPTIVTRNGMLRMVLGSPGGATIITTVTNIFLSVADGGLNIQDAVDAPRFHHQYLPDIVDVDKFMPADKVRALEAMGYTVNASRSTWGDGECIEVDPGTHDLLGGHDSRHTFGKADGY